MSDLKHVIFCTSLPSGLCPFASQHPHRSRYLAWKLRCHIVWYTNQDTHSEFEVKSRDPMLTVANVCYRGANKSSPQRRYPGNAAISAAELQLISLHLCFVQYRPAGRRKDLRC